MISRLPEGGVAYEKPHWDEDAVTELLDDFFATPAGAPFADDDYRDVLLELCESGFGDPLRWSTFRISDILRLPYHDEHVPLEIALDAPALLRAFVPFAHSRSGIGQDITGDALKTIDDMSRGYRRRLLDDAMVYYDEGDADPGPGAATRTRRREWLSVASANTMRTRKYGQACETCTCVTFRTRSWTGWSECRARKECP